MAMAAKARRRLWLIVLSAIALFLVAIAVAIAVFNPAITRYVEGRSFAPNWKNKPPKACTFREQQVRSHPPHRFPHRRDTTASKRPMAAKH